MSSGLPTHIIRSLYVCLLLLLLYAYKKKSTIMYFWQNGLFYGGYIFAMLSAIPTALFILLFGLPRCSVLRLWNTILTFVAKLSMFTFEIRNDANIIKNDEAAIVIMNHQDTFDMLIHNYICDKYSFDLTLIAKKKTCPVWPFDAIARNICSFAFINNDGTIDDQARNDIKRMITDAKDRKMKILCYPEGTRNSDGKLSPFKRGAFKIAIENQLPIMILVTSPYYFLDRRRKQIRRGKLIIDALEPVRTNGLTLDDTDRLMETVRNDMIAKYIELQVEVSKQ